MKTTFAERFAAADPASTPLGAPLPDEALALLDRVMTPRPELHSAAPVRRSRIPRLLIGIAAPAVALAVLVSIVVGIWGWFRLGVTSAPEPTAMASAAPPMASDGAPVPSLPPQPLYNTEEELVAAADAIITAETVSSGFVEHDGGFYQLATVRVISVDRSSGLTAGRLIHVAFPDPSMTGGEWPLGLDPGLRALFFLTLPDPLGVPGADASLVNVSQGSYQLELEDPTPQANSTNPVALDGSFLSRHGLMVS